MRIEIVAFLTLLSGLWFTGVSGGEQKLQLSLDRDEQDIAFASRATVYETVATQIKLETTHNTFQGHIEVVSLYIENSDLQMGGFDFLISFDPEVLTLVEVLPGELLTDCDW